MFDKMFKKKAALPEIPKKNGESEEEIEVPEVDDTLAKVDEALAKAEAMEKTRKAQERKEQKAREAREREEAERNSGSRCGCGW